VPPQDSDYGCCATAVNGYYRRLPSQSPYPLFTHRADARPANDYALGPTPTFVVLKSFVNLQSCCMVVCACRHSPLGRGRCVVSKLAVRGWRWLCLRAVLHAYRCLPASERLRVGGAQALPKGPSLQKKSDLVVVMAWSYNWLRRGDA
jgi:hypothetical protein